MGVYEGTKKRRRYCDNPAPKHGGNKCFGALKATTTCGKTQCGMTFGPWAPWECFNPGTASNIDVMNEAKTTYTTIESVACGPGQRARTRKGDNEFVDIQRTKYCNRWTDEAGTLKTPKVLLPAVRIYGDNEDACLADAALLKIEITTKITPWSLPDTDDYAGCRATPCSSSSHIYPKCKRSEYIKDTFNANQPRCGGTNFVICCKEWFKWVTPMRSGVTQCGFKTGISDSNIKTVTVVSKDSEHFVGFPLTMQTKRIDEKQHCIEFIKTHRGTPELNYGTFWTIIYIRNPIAVSVCAACTEKFDKKAIFWQEEKPKMIKLYNSSDKGAAQYFFSPRFDGKCTGGKWWYEKDCENARTKVQCENPAAILHNSQGIFECKWKYIKDPEPDYCFWAEEENKSDPCKTANKAKIGNFDWYTSANTEKKKKEKQQFLCCPKEKQD